MTHALRSLTKFLAIGSALTLALAGCARVTLDYTVSADGMVSGSYVYALSSEVGTAEDAAERFNTAGEEQLFANATMSDYESADGFVGQTITFVDEPIASFATAGLGPLSITARGTEIEVVGQLVDFASQGLTMEQLEQSGAEFTASITFPGGVIETNGVVSGNTVTWNMLTATTAPYALGSAVANERTPGWAFGAGAVLVAGLLAFVALNRRTGDTSTTNGA